MASAKAYVNALNKAASAPREAPERVETAWGLAMRSFESANE